MTHFRLTWLKQGGHYHCQLRSATSETTTHALNGELVFDEREWPDVLAAFGRFAEVREAAPAHQNPRPEHLCAACGLAEEKHGLQVGHYFRPRPDDSP